MLGAASLLPAGRLLDLHFLYLHLLLQVSELGCRFACRLPLGIRTIGQLRQWPVDTLHRHFGSQGEHLWQLAHGIDHRLVVPEQEARSISHETTFETDIDNQDVLRAWLLDLTEQVAWRLRRRELRGRVVQLKVRFADFSTITRSQTLQEPTDVTEELWQIADRGFCARLPADHLPVRLLGMGVGGLDASGVKQRLLFDQEQRQRRSGLDATRDQVRERFGSSALRRATSLPQHGKPRPGKGDSGRCGNGATS